MVQRSTEPLRLQPASDGAAPASPGTEPKSFPGEVILGADPGPISWHPEVTHEMTRQTARVGHTDTLAERAICRRTGGSLFNSR